MCISIDVCVCVCVCVYQVIEYIHWVEQASQVVLVVKNPPANAGDVTDTSSIPGSGRSPGKGNGNPLQFSCLENSMECIVQAVTKSRT